MKTNTQNAGWQNVVSWETACERAKRDPNVLPDVSMLDPKFQKYITAAYKLAVIFEAVNTNDDGTIWEPDRADHNQRKYFSYHEVNTSGGGFSLSSYDCWFTDSYVGSRLETSSWEKVAHINQHFEDLWIDFKLFKRD